MVNIEEAGPEARALPEGRGAGTRGRRADRRAGRRFRWSHCLFVCLAAFLLWLLVDAPALQHSAETSPIGTRRTVALAILGPIASLSRGIGVSHIVSVADGIIGRNGNGVGRENGTFISKGPAAVPHRPPSPSDVRTRAQGGTTVTTVPPWRHPTASAPLRVLVIGDSLGIDLGDTLVNDLSNTGVVSATLDGVESTGLARPDYFNWPAELQTDLGKIVPELVVIMVGANDPQAMPSAGGSIPYGSPQWDQVYSQRVESFMSEASSGGAKVIWVGMPPMQSPGLSGAMQHLDQIYQTEAARNPNVTYLSSWTLLGTPQGQYTAYINSGGQEVNVREPDGTHISPGGGEVLSQAVMSTMRQQLRIQLPG